MARKELFKSHVQQCMCDFFCQISLNSKYCVFATLKLQKEDFWHFSFIFLFYL